MIPSLYTTTEENGWVLSPFRGRVYHLHKGEFRDVKCLRYGWDLLPNTPQTCVVTHGLKWTMHSLVAYGGFVHNEIRILTASEVCHNELSHPHNLLMAKHDLRSILTLSWLPDFCMTGHNITARGFWNHGHGQHAYFDIRVLTQMLQATYSLYISKVYQSHVQSKKKKYTQMYGVFTPLPLAEWQEKNCGVFYKQLAHLQKKQSPYMPSQLAAFVVASVLLH